MKRTVVASPGDVPVRLKASRPTPGAQCRLADLWPGARFRLLGTDIRGRVRKIVSGRVQVQVDGVRTMAINFETADGRQVAFSTDDSRLADWAPATLVEVEA